MSSIQFGNYTTPEKEDLMIGNEVTKPIKEHQFFTSCYVTDMELHDGKYAVTYAVTVVAWYDLKRYMEFYEPNMNDEIFQELDIIAVGLDGNGVPRIGWHEKKLVKEVKTQHYKDGETMSIVDSFLGTGTTLVEKKVSMFPPGNTLKDKPIMASKQKANHKNLADNLFCEKKLLFGADKEIKLDDDFILAIEVISKFTRENDTTFPHSAISKEMQEFDNIRTAVGLISTILPIGKAYKMQQTLIGYLADAFSGSALTTPAYELYDLRGPVKLSKVTKQIYESKYGQSGNRHYYKQGDSNEKDEIELFR